LVNTSSCAITHYLTVNPEAQRKLQAELDSDSTCPILTLSDQPGRFFVGAPLPSASVAKWAEIHAIFASGH
jgi:hypothetical protein